MASYELLVLLVISNSLYLSLLRLWVAQFDKRMTNCFSNRSFWHCYWRLGMSSIFKIYVTSEIDFDWPSPIEAGWSFLCQEIARSVPDGLSPVGRDRLGTRLTNI